MSDEQSSSDSVGYLRVVIWFSLSGVVLVLFSAIRLAAAQPNWWLLVALMGALSASGARGFRDLLRLKAGATRERPMQIAMGIFGSLAVAGILGFSWRYGAAEVMRMLETYLFPALVPSAFAYAALAGYVERKHKVRVFVGNRGWLFLPRSVK